MENRMKKRSVATILLVMLFACITCLAVLFAIPLTRGRASGEDETQAPAATFYLGTSARNDKNRHIYYCPNFTNGWRDSVNYALEAYKTDFTAYVKVVLMGDWIAEDSSVGFGYVEDMDTDSFDGGSILSPLRTNIVIDLNGHKIDRNLSDAVEDGNAIIVKGTLTVEDNSAAQNGKITGAYNYDSTLALGGGVRVNGGTFNLKGGSIEGNRASGTNVYGLGVLVNGGMFNMYGGTIAGHENTSDITYGGGVCVYENGMFNMFGGVIEDNHAVFGGGVAIYDTTGSYPKTSFVLMDGIIHSNDAITGDSASSMAGGGGICVYGKGNLYIENCEIRNNRTDAYGGGVFYYGSGKGTPTFLLGSACGIRDNVAWSLERSVYGGGVAIYADPEQAVVINAQFEATIRENLAVANCNSEGSSYEAQGGGLYVDGAKVTMRGGWIGENRSASSQEDFAEADIEDLIDGYATFGGGVSVGEHASLEILRDAVIQSNRAAIGGGVNTKGSLSVHGGQIDGNDGVKGGGIYPAQSARLSFSGGATVEYNFAIVDGERSAQQSNLEITSIDTRLHIEGELVNEWGNPAQIHISVDKSFIENGVPFTEGYGEHNKKTITVAGTGDTVDVYANPYRFFVPDTIEGVGGAEDDLSGRHIMLLANKEFVGELGVARKIIEYKITYTDTQYEGLPYGDEESLELPDWNCLEFTYDETKRPVSVAAYADNMLNGESLGEMDVENKAGIYTLKANSKVDGVEIEFSIIIHSKELSTEDVDITLSGTEDFKYDGEKKVPTGCKVQLKDGGEVLVEGTHYTLVYKNNVNAGRNTAMAVITFINDFTGEARAYFTIQAAEGTDLVTRVTWQLKKNGIWVNFGADDYENAFTYDGTDQSGKIRAWLVPGNDEPQMVYASSITDGENQNPALSLQFYRVGEGETDAFERAGQYNVSIQGIVNYPIEKDAELNGVVMNKMALGVSEAEFSQYYRNDDGTRLWSLIIGEGDDAPRTTLLDKPKFISPNGTENEYGVKTETGGYYDAYARYRGVPLSIVFNDAFKLQNGKTVKEFLELASSVTYEHDGNRVGVMNAINNVTTTVTIVFDENYDTGVENNTFKIEKWWLIVTMPNALRTVEDKAEVASTELAGWTYRKWEQGAPDSVKGVAFRAEHGDTVIYTYYREGEEKFIKRFALVYSNDTSYATMRFHEVTEENGEFKIGALIGSDKDYLLEFNSTLQAGNYRLDVTVPRVDPLTGSHRHWYDSNAIATDYGVRYYEFTCKFTFTVGTYKLPAFFDAGNPNLTVEFPEVNYIEYTGEANRVVSNIVIKLYNKELKENVDYVLLSSSVDAGDASLTVKGINSLEGEFTIEKAFKINPARNGWRDVPSISHWTYNAFDREINLISADPEFGREGLWFAISHDEAGTDLISGLEHITLDENGQVSEAVAKILKGLHAGVYYLFGYVDEAQNYEGLAPNAVEFSVFVANNSWELTPSVNMWTEGEYTEEGGHVLASAAFGVAHILIVDDNGTVYFDSDNDINKLNKAKAGRYTLTAYVDAGDDYFALDVYTVIFDVFEKPGLPWWVGALIALGALGIAAGIIFILWKTGVFSFVTDKIMVSIRTSATVEATLAAVRAAKMMEEGRQSVEAAKRRERLEELLKKEREQSAMAQETGFTQVETPIETAIAEAPSAEQAPATKAPATKASATKTSATKTSASKTSATKAPASKTSATKAPAAKTTGKKSPIVKTTGNKKTSNKTSETPTKK